MRACIHRGANEIGGTCIELESQGKRLVLDVGLPLNASDIHSIELHPIEGFQKPDPSLLGVIISHPHIDHYGLASRLPTNTQFLLGKAARKILETASFFTPSGLTLANVIEFQDRHEVRLGPFSITPFLVDHSAYDSYAFLIEADGERLFYSGDFRTHGRKRRSMQQFLSAAPKAVDTLVMEGTTLERANSKQAFPTEDDIVEEFIGLFESAIGIKLVWASGQNIDRLVSLYKACIHTNHILIIDMYTASVLRATGNERIPQASWDRIRVFLPWSQKSQIIRSKNFELADVFKADRIYSEEISEIGDKCVMLFRPSMMGDLDRITNLKIGCLVCSVWSGYLKDERNQPLLDWLENREIPLSHCHTSGHADLTSLHDLRNAFPEAVVVPVHLTNPSNFESTFHRAKRHEDGQWWDVRTKTALENRKLGDHHG